MSFAVASPEGILCAGAIGYADLAEGRESTVNDQYPWFSMTKIATATAAVSLHADGQLDLDAPVGTYLPDYRPTKHGHPTTRQLLTHTAGLANPRKVSAASTPPRRPREPSTSQTRIGNVMKGTGQIFVGGSASVDAAPARTAIRTRHHP